MLLKRLIKTSLFSEVTIACSGQACEVEFISSDITKCLSRWWWESSSWLKDSLSSTHWELKEKSPVAAQAAVTIYNLRVSWQALFKKSRKSSLFMWTTPTEFQDWSFFL